MSSPNEVYLITGANNGLGFEIASVLLKRPNATIIAGVRNLSSLSDLESVERGRGSKLISLKIDSTSETDAAKAVAELKSKHQIQHLDVVVANAGYGTVYGVTTDTKPQDLRETFEINAIGPLLLFQATWDLLAASKNPPFVLSSSPIGSIGGIETQDYPLVAYGASKAAANYITRRIHFEHEKLIAFSIDPGFMRTDTGNTGARYLGLHEAFVDPKDSAAFIVGQIDGATREKTSGKFLSIGTNPPGGIQEW